jgi:hypothetical protein
LITPIIRLFELVAEENAIEDTIYILTQALIQDKVELNAYMKVQVSTWRPPLVLIT